MCQGDLNSRPGESETNLEEKITAAVSIAVDYEIGANGEFNIIRDAAGNVQANNPASNLFGVSGQQDVKTLRLKFR